MGVSDTTNQTRTIALEPSRLGGKRDDAGGVNERLSARQ